MGYSPATRIVLPTLCVGVLTVVLSYIEATTLGMSRDSLLWDTGITVVPMWTVYIVFWHWSGEQWWFLPLESVDQ